MVPEHLPSMLYTHVTSGRVWNLESVTFVSQSSACGGWLGLSYCLLSGVVSCWRWSDKIGLSNPQFITVACALIDIDLWVSRLHVKMNFVPDMFA